jgi:hypothetical protein
MLLDYFGLNSVKPYRLIELLQPNHLRRPTSNATMRLTPAHANKHTLCVEPMQINTHEIFAHRHHSLGRTRTTAWVLANRC